MAAEPCKHKQTRPEGAEWPADVALEHFDQCLTPERRAEVWADIRKRENVGWRCVMEDHDGRIKAQAEYTRKLLTDIRELLDSPKVRLDIIDRLRGMIS